MSEEASHKSHATGWIVGAVVAVVLYVGSAVPVCLSFASSKGNWLPRSWGEPVGVFYTPAGWLLSMPPLKEFNDRWLDFWMRVLDVQWSE